MVHKEKLYNYFLPFVFHYMAQISNYHILQISEGSFNLLMSIGIVLNMGNILIINTAIHKCVYVYGFFEKNPVFSSNYHLKI